MNLYKLALGGLNAAQAGIATTSHNINNSTTVGYNRQRVMTSTAGAQATSNGFIGRGVQVDTVVRSYDSFLYKQLVGAQGSGAQLQTQFDQISQVNNLFADRTVGIAPALSGFFTGVNTAANAPADPAARSDMLGKSNSLATQIRSAYQEMQNQRLGLNTQVGTVVEQTNSYLARINDLNEQISAARAKAGGQPPNDLMDQRDQAVSELNQLVHHHLRAGRQAQYLAGFRRPGAAVGPDYLPAAGRAPSKDISRTVVAYTLPAGAGGKTVTVELGDTEVTGGKLGGLLQFRANSLDVTQSQLGQMAVGLALSFNAQHKLGLDQNGNPGGDYFSIGQPQGVPNAQNKSNAQISGTFGTVGNINAKDYDITFDGTNYMVTRMPEGTQVYNGPATGTPPTATLDLDAEAGVRLTISAPPQAGDKWSVADTRRGARPQCRDHRSQQDRPGRRHGRQRQWQERPEAGAAADRQGPGGNTTSINEMFSQVVNTVGVQTQQIKSAATAQANLITQKKAAQQNVSGVNLNEEYVSLSQYQEQYQASARIINVASTMFDTLLGLRG